MPLGKRRTSGKKIPANVNETPTDNTSFHHGANALKWKYICQRRLELERELGKDALECEQIMKLVDKAGLIKVYVALAIVMNCW